MRALSKYKLLFFFVVVAETVVELQGKSPQGGREHLRQAPGKFIFVQIYWAEKIVGEGRNVFRGGKGLQIKPFNKAVPVFASLINTSNSPTLLFEQM